jgi:plasmid stabilization system protein ParE
VDSAVRWIARDNPDAAERLNDAVLHACRRLGASPSLGRPAPSPFPPTYRPWSLTQFGYLLVNDPAADPVAILRCAHVARDLPRALEELRGPLKR